MSLKTRQVFCCPNLYARAIACMKGLALHILVEIYIDLQILRGENKLSKKINVIKDEPGEG